MKRMAAAVVGLCLGVGCGGAEEDALHRPPTTVTPSGRSAGLASQRLKSRGGAISNHGGAAMTGTPNVYFVWYGNWSANSATTILPDLVSNLGGSPYFNITSTYSDASGTHL